MKLSKISLLKFVVSIFLLLSNMHIYAQTRLKGLLYDFGLDDYIAIQYKRSYHNTGTTYTTKYSVFHPTKGYEWIVVKATHDALNKIINVSVDDANGGLFFHVNDEMVTYDSPSLKPFGKRGMVGQMGGKRIPNQLMVHFVSNKFENVKVGHILASSKTENLDRSIYLLLDEDITTNNNENVSKQNPNTAGQALFKGNKNNALVQGSKLGDPLVSNSAVEKRLAEEIEIKSMIYDLEKFAPEKYLASYNIQRDAIVSYFIRGYNNNTENFPSFKSLINSKVHMQRFRNTYNIKYRLKDNGRESVNRGNVVIGGTRDITTLKEIELVSGNDSDLSLFKSASISIPTIKIEGHEVMTEAKFNNVLVDFTRGLTEVKIKKNEVEFKKYPPEKDFQELLINELKTKGVNGKYLVKYEIQDIMGQSGVNIELEKK